MKECDRKPRKNTSLASINGWKNRSKVASQRRVMAVLASKAKARSTSRTRWECITGTFSTTRRRFHLLNAESRLARGALRLITKMYFSADQALCEVALLVEFPGTTRP